LLGLVEAVDLIEEEDRRAARGTPLLRTRDHLAHLGAAGVDGGELFEGPPRPRGADPGEGRLAGARGPVEDGAVRLAGLARDPAGGARLEQVALPAQFVEVAGAHADGERGLLRGHARAACLLAGLEEPVGHSRSDDRLTSILWTSSALLLDMLPQYEPRHRS